MSEAALLSPGLVIADTYEVVRLLGRGGMGEVWLATHRRLAGKQVAVKVLRVQGDVSAEALARFKREAELAARLEHPNIVQVLDYNTLPSGEPFLVMELLKGQSLAERLRAGPLPVEQVQQLLRQVGAALQVAHAAGVVHRDLKPENIFLQPTALGDQVKVLDFGISKVADSASVQTSDAVVMGTPLYMSPEQALGQNRDLTPQSDLFSLGSICFELLTGKAPFEAESLAQVMFRIAYQPAPSLTAARGDLPPAVVAAVEHALEKERARRTPDIATFVTELTGTPLAAAAPGLPTQPSAGLYTPGMAVSESVLSGKTAAPQARTPAVAGPPPPAPAPVSGRKVAVGLVAAAVVLSAGVIATRQYWQHLPTPPVPPEVTAALDAVAPARAEAVDAGPAVAVAEAAVDAGAPAVVAPARPAAAVPDVAGPEDAELLARLKALHDARDYEGLESQRNQVRRIGSRKARAQALGWVVDAMCQRSSNVTLAPAIEELKAVAPPATVRAARQACVAVYPSAADFGW